MADAERDFSIPELAELLGERYFDLLAALEGAGFLERRSQDGVTSWHCPDLPLLRGALDLVDVGTDVELAARARDLLKRRTRRLAEDLVELWTARPDERTTSTPAELEQFRLVAWQSAAYVMAQEIERAIQAAEALGEAQS